MGIFAALGLVLALHVTCLRAPSRAVARVLAAAAFPPVAAVRSTSRSRAAASRRRSLGVVALRRHRAPARACSARCPPSARTSALAVLVAYDADLLGELALRRRGGGRPARARPARPVIGCALAAAGLRVLALRILDPRVERYGCRSARRDGRARRGRRSAASWRSRDRASRSDLPRRIDQERREFGRGDDPARHARPARPPDAHRQQRPRRELARRARGLRGGARATARAPAPTGCCGSATGRRRRSRSATATRCTSRSRRSSAGRPRAPARSRCCHRSRSRSRAFAATSATPTRPSSPPGGCCCIHAGVDWDWEMPALFLWFFGAAGRRARPRRRREPRGARAGAADAPDRGPRVPRSLALTPGDGGVLADRAQPRGRRRSTRGDCATATDAALGSLEAFASPARSRSRCSAGATRAPAQNALAVRAMRSAVARDPGNWQYAYGLAVARRWRARTRARRRRAHAALNPLEPLARDLERGLRTEPRRAGAGSRRGPRSRGARRREAGRSPPLGRTMPGCRAQLLLARAAPQHEARAQQRDAAEQDRHRREAGERQLESVVGARLDLARRLHAVGSPLRRRPGLPPPAVSSGWTPVPASSSPRTPPPPVGVLSASGLVLRPRRRCR